MTVSTYAVSCDLAGEAGARVRAQWDALERRFALRTARAAGHPHLTFVVGECAEPSLLLRHVAEAARQMTGRLEGVDLVQLVLPEHCYCGRFPMGAAPAAAPLPSAGSSGSRASSENL